jgi:hypothetical protein
MRRPLALAALFLLSACGGGSSSDGPGNSLYNPQAAWRALLEQPRTWSVSGTDNSGQAWRFDSTYTSLPDALFAATGEAGRRQVQTTQAFTGGTSLGTASGTLYYESGSLGLIGSVDDDGQCSQAIVRQAPPASAEVGASDRLATLRALVQCSAGSAWNGLTNLDWALRSEAGLVFFCVDLTLLSASGSQVLATQSECYDLPSSGALGARVRLTLAVPSTGFSLVARNY